MASNGYFRLIGKTTCDTSSIDNDFQYYAQSLHLMIGRKKSETASGAYTFVSLCEDDTSISRIHVTIDYNDDKFYLNCISKNGVTINKIKYDKDTKGVQLHNGDAIKVGKARIYFQLPKQHAPSDDSPLQLL